MFLKKLRKYFDDSPDSGMMLGQPNIIRKLWKEFQVIQQRTHRNFKLISQQFRQFVIMLFLRRKNRLDDWIEMNTKKFKTEEERKKIERWIGSVFKPEVKALEQQLEPCLEKCSDKMCNFRCLLSTNHKTQASHDCLGDHKCHETCTYCIQDDVCFFDESNCRNSVCMFLE